MRAVAVPSLYRPYLPMTGARTDKRTYCISSLYWPLEVPITARFGVVMGEATPGGCFCLIHDTAEPWLIAARRRARRRPRTTIRHRPAGPVLSVPLWAHRIRDPDHGRAAARHRGGAFSSRAHQEFFQLYQM